MADETNATTQGATSTEAGQGAQTDTAQQSSNQQDIESMIQRAVDRATNKLGNENKNLRKQLDDMKKSKMTDDEARQVEMQEKEKEIADREKALTDREHKLFAIKALEEIGLRDSKGSSTSLVDFVMADTEEGITNRVKALNSLVDELVKAKVDGVFKSNGRTPAVGTDSNQPQTSFAARLGKSAADANAKSRSTLDYYVGGNKR